MKSTVEIPDELHRHLKAKLALQKKNINELTIQLYSDWLEEEKRRDEQAASFAEVAREYQGKFKSGIKDLGSNPKHLEGFGK